MGAWIRRKPLHILGLAVLILPVRQAPAGQTAVVAEGHPGSPIRISPAKPTGVQSVAGKDHLAFTYLIENVSDRNVVLYAINWIWQDASGAVIKKGDYSYFWSFDADKPVLRPGESRSLTKDFLPRGAVLKARVDSVLLSDGSAYGPDESRTRQRFRYMLSATRSTERRILSLLESQGAEKVKEILRRNLAAEVQERKYFETKLIPPMP